MPESIEESMRVKRKIYQIVVLCPTHHCSQPGSTKVQTSARQTRARMCTASWHASFVSTCALPSHTKWPTYCSHTMQEAVYLSNGAVSEKSTQIFWPSLPVEYVIWFSGRKYALEMRCRLTHRNNPRCACTPRVETEIFAQFEWGQILPWIWVWRRKFDMSSVKS